MPEKPPVVVITGASRGIGRGIALRVAELGCSIVINYSKNVDASKETVELCEKKKTDAGQRFIAVQGDVSRKDHRDSLVEKTLQEFGRIDALVNNAGVGPARRVDVTEMEEESLRGLLAVNLEGPHFLTQSIARYWLKEKPRPLLPGGLSVIFISSASAEMVSLNRGEYCISKAGLSMSAKLWAARLAAHGITVIELRPGIMATDMTKGVKEKYDAMLAEGLVPQKRWGTADEVGLAVKAILSGHFPFSTGSTIAVDGGLTIPRL